MPTFVLRRMRDGRYVTHQTVHRQKGGVMIGYVLQRIRDGAYVARKGSASSYTKWVERAEIFPTREAAQGNACVESERVVSIDEIFRGNVA